ncbi:MAG: hypothetical protein C0605_07820 [Hyphomicrobiales bacterium]|nr:MAG: hypothetical protein C0605_07820 [Hyphomicrobiales bacterium]
MSPLPSNCSPENRARAHQARALGFDAVAARRSAAGRAGCIAARNERLRGAVTLPALKWGSGK